MNKNLNRAKADKMDEFYTLLTDIEKEMEHYKVHFGGKTIFLNCDDPEESNFWKFFSLNFDFLGIGKLISTHFEEDKPSYKLEMTPTGVVRTELVQNGDFRSPECVELLNESDIVITNPPFSLFRDFIALLVEHQKKFLVLGNLNALKYKEIFPLIQGGELWLGVNNGAKVYTVPPDYSQGGSFVDEKGNRLVSLGNTVWYTNLDLEKRHEKLFLFRKYNSEDFPKYDAYDAIEVSKVKNIPEDYDGLMGVPITFLDKWNPEQFDIVGLDRYLSDNPRYGSRFRINGKELYSRIVIRRR